MTRLLCPPRPCKSCPYRRDVPSGVWHPEEYTRLAEYDEKPDRPVKLEAFHCHQENAHGRPTVCVGWLGCHGTKAVAVRVALASGQLTLEDVDRAHDTDVPLHRSGVEAALAGLRDIAHPSPEACRLIDRLLTQGAAREDPRAPTP